MVNKTRHFKLAIFRQSESTIGVAYTKYQRGLS